MTNNEDQISKPTKACTCCEMRPAEYRSGLCTTCAPWRLTDTARRFFGLWLDDVTKNGPFDHAASIQKFEDKLNSFGIDWEFEVSAFDSKTGYTMTYSVTRDGLEQ